MATVSAVPTHTSPAIEKGHTHGAPSSIPWYLWCSALAVTCTSVGFAWDISWHSTIGRDSFWNPAHVTIYMSAILAGIASGYLILTTTFKRASAFRSTSVRVLGLRGPLGAFIAAWGGIAMLTSAPFDDWWHNAYGLDVKIISPPHTLLFLGTRGIALGALFLLLAALNRASLQESAAFRPAQRLLLYLGVLAVADQMLFFSEAIRPTAQHSLTPYDAVAKFAFILLALFSAASRHRWAATIMSSGYMVFVIGQILILPLFPAQPRLGPVYFPVTHMVPTHFPLLLVVPGLVLDLIRERTASWRPTISAVVAGFVAIGAFVAVEWPFADFLLSPAAQNRFFGGGYFSYDASPASRVLAFRMPEHGMHLVTGLLIAALYASVGIWLGGRLGTWMRGVQR
ncbi:MAG TPA: hypothetical protein VGM27_03445 [Acidobacteriaceae bacterium]